jgi:pimeloyl-ACP methyl ester carboxylesterase
MRAERGGHGGLIRVFTVKGEDASYREQMTWFSDSDRTLGYTHLDGISDCEAYDARVSVSPAPSGGATVKWTATISAPVARLQGICNGTRTVFEIGIAALKSAASPSPLQHVNRGAELPEHVILDNPPRIAMSVTPPVSGKTLAIFLHGIGGDRHNWQSAQMRTGHLIQSVAMNLRGYGGSALGPSQTGVDDYCDDILRVKAFFGADKLVLVGLSYGSWIATSFAMRHPDILAGLVLSGGCTGMSEAGAEEREEFRLAREVPLNAGKSPADFAIDVVKVLAGPNANLGMRNHLFQTMAAIPASTYRDALVCFTNPLERFDFSRLTMPVLLVTGEHDRLAPPAEIRAVAGRILDSAPHPDVRFEVIAGAGHVCNVEAPEIYNRHLLDFLGKVAP